MRNITTVATRSFFYNLENYQHLKILIAGGKVWSLERFVRVETFRQFAPNLRTSCPVLTVVSCRAATARRRSNECHRQHNTPGSRSPAEYHHPFHQARSPSNSHYDSMPGGEVKTAGETGASCSTGNLWQGTMVSCSVPHTYKAINATYFAILQHVHQQFCDVTWIYDMAYPMLFFLVQF